MESRQGGSQGDDDSYPDQDNGAVGGQPSGGLGYQGQGKEEDNSSRGGDLGGHGSANQLRYQQRERYSQSYQVSQSREKPDERCWTSG